MNPTPTSRIQRLGRLSRLAPALLLIILGSAVLADSPAPATSQPTTQSSDLWYRVYMGGNAVGWSHSTTTLQDHLIVSHEEMHMSLRRAGAAMAVDEVGDATETTAGDPVSLTVNEVQSGVPTTVSIEVHPDEFIVTRGHGDDQTRQTLSKDPTKLPPGVSTLGKWLPAEASRIYVRDQIRGNAREITFPTIDPTLAVAVKKAHYVRIGDEILVVAGKKIPTTKWTYTIEGLESMPSKVWLDDEANPVKLSLPLMPGLEMMSQECTREEALAGVTPQEMMINSFITPDRTVPDARKLRKASFEIHFNASDLGDAFKAPAMSRASYQRVIWDNRTTALVIVDMDDPVTPEADLPKDADRVPNLMINFNSPKMEGALNQSKKLFSEKDDNAAKAEKLRRFVVRYINRKDMDVGMTNAGETAESRHGDCKGHAVLLAALLRANKIPARVAMGIVYADQFAGKRGIFGYHMWTQAWLALPNEDGKLASRWVDLDSALSLDQPFDATHIAFLTSPLADDKADEQTAAVSPIMGRISIKVVTPEEPAEPAKTVVPATTQPEPKSLPVQK